MGFRGQQIDDDISSDVLIEETTISSFLSSKKVCSYLASKGPALGMNTIDDISRILRRKCPSESMINEGFKSVQNRDDNLWALDGEEDKEMIQGRWDDTSESIIKRHKRRRLHDHPDGQLSDQIGQQELSIGTSTTMQNSSTFSYQGQNGFTTATQMIRAKRQDQNASSSAEIENPRSNWGKSQPRKPSEDQGSLLRFWAASKHTDKIFDNRSGQVQTQQFTCKRRMKEVNSFESSSSNIAAVTNMPASYEQSQYTYPKKPLSVIPQGLADHKLIPIPGAGRPNLISAKDKHTFKQYVFLSSSPPPFHETGKEDADLDSDKYHQGIKIKSGTVGLETTLDDDDIRPATTFHTTSMTQAKLNASKKTLGVRRSMNGWNSRGNQPFSIPRVNKRDS